MDILYAGVLTATYANIAAGGVFLFKGLNRLSGHPPQTSKFSRNVFYAIAAQSIILQGIAYFNSNGFNSTGELFDLLISTGIGCFGASFCGAAHLYKDWKQKGQQRPNQVPVKNVPIRRKIPT